MMGYSARVCSCIVTAFPLPCHTPNIPDASGSVLSVLPGGVSESRSGKILLLLDKCVVIKHS